MATHWSVGFILLTACTFLAAGDTSDKFGIQQVVSFSNRLVPKLLQAFSGGRDNLVVAPFGLATNLAMVMEGVNKKLADEMAVALHLQTSNIVKQSLRHGFKTILTEFEEGQEDEEAAGSYNHATIRSSAPFSANYKNVLETFYRVNITQEDGFNSSEQLWEVKSDTGVMSHWKDFHKLAVYTYLSHQPAADFTTHEGKTILVPMIPRVGVFHVGYLSRLNSQAVELQLEANRASLLIIMPDSHEAMNEVILRLSNEKLSSVSSSLPIKECEVSLPQFAIVTSDLDLSPFLSKLGISKIFTPSNEKSKGGSVKFIKQNAYFATSFVSVNSVGTSGAALEKGSGNKRAKRGVPLKLEINKPFLFFLIHRSTGLVLLSGVVQKPTQIPS